MASIRSALCLVLLPCLGVAGNQECQAANDSSSTAAKPTVKIRGIILIAGEETSHEVILKQIGLKPGQQLDYAALRQAEKNLAALKLFVVDPERGIRPTVTVLDPDSDSAYRDIVVTVQELAPLKMFPKGQQHDFGKVVRGTEAKYSFPIFNPTSAPITFLAVRWSVCAAPYIPAVTLAKRVLQPKEEAELQVLLDTRRLSGPKIACIWLDVQTAEGQKTYVFTIKADTMDASVR
jgi:hypothetical protein